jgi:hypothetical protein
MLERTRKKLREAEFFLQALTGAEPEVFRQEPEAADFYLSAFLTAGRSVTFALRKEQNVEYEAWKPGWFAKLAPDDATLMKFFVDQRNQVQKEGELDFAVTLKTVSLGEFLQDFYSQGGNLLFDGNAGNAAADLSKSREAIRRPIRGHGSRGLQNIS